VLAEQVEPALAMRPGLVSVYAGGNDLLRPVVDVDAMVAAYAEGVARIRATGAHLVLFTGFDLMDFADLPTTAMDLVNNFCLDSTKFPTCSQG
jgi:hypothetical protein